MDLVIRTQDLSKSYDGLWALNSLDLMVPRHSIFGFLGPNGAGKTTTIKLLLGLAKPTSGSGFIFGQEIGKDSLEIRKRVGYLAQDLNYYGYMTARETLRFKARFYYRGPKAAIEQRVAETLDLVGLADKADRRIKGFSGGERQRLGIAQAQINHPDLLILDEPAASLDPMGRRDVLDVMDRLREFTTILYTTHILDDVQRVSDVVAIMNRGQLVAQAPIEKLLTGSGTMIYALAFEGDGRHAHARISRQPWVSRLAESSVNGRTEWRVTVTDEETAKAEFLRLVMADEQLVVTSFGRTSCDLEEIFMNIVEEDNHG